MPAISHFFRDVFIIRHSQKTKAYGSTMFLETTGSTMALYSYKMSGQVNIPQVLQELGFGKVTNEFMQMLDVLMQASTIPRVTHTE
jgi:hypothetical protein